MARISFLEAIRQAQFEELARDDSVFLMGEDIRCNVFGTTTGLVEAFGEERIRDTPISEAGFVGAAAGASMVGMRPIVDLTIATFVYPAMDQVCSIIAKSRYLYGGQAKLPLVLRLCMFYGNSNAAQHSDRPYPMFMGMPGLKIIVPSNPTDMKGLLKSAIRDDDPVMSFEDGTLWSGKSEVPDHDDFLVPLGVADVKRTGSDVSVIAIGGCVPLALAAAETLADEGISVEVIDPRTLVPLDTETILKSVTKTGRAITVDPAHQSCSAASEISATIVEQAFGALKAPVIRVTTPDTHLPFSPPIEKPLYPSAERIIAAIRRTLVDSQADSMIDSERKNMKTVDVLLPQSGMGMQDGEILHWLKNEGDAVSEGEAIVEVEAAKIVIEIPSPCNGILLSTLAAEGEVVEVRAVIAKIQTE